MAKAVVFAGQGSQRIGMGKDFIESFPESKRVFEEASSALSIDLEALCFKENTKLNLTEFTQPAIVTAELAIFEALNTHYGFNPGIFAGHSLGEYSALIAAGVLALSDGVKIVSARGVLMQQAVNPERGAMAAIIGKFDTELIEALSEKHGCDLANYNSSEQVVISGEKVSVLSCSEAVQSAFPDVRVVELNVSAPFHSRLMKTVERKFAEVLISFEPRLNKERASKVLSNFTGSFHIPEWLLDALVSQISSPVRWTDNMKILTERSSEILEITPQRTLGKFFSTQGLDISSISDLRTAERYFGGRIQHAG